MKGKRLIFVLLCLFVLLLCIGAWIYRKNYSNPTEGDVNLYKKINSSPQNTPSFAHWQLYNNTLNSFSLRIPSEWKIDNEFKNGKPTGKVTFTPSSAGEKIGALQMISISAAEVNTAKQTLSSQEEFNKLYQKNTKSNGDFEKLDSFTVDNVPAILLLNKKHSTNNSYQLVTWFRNNKKNYLIISEGNQKLSPDDIYANKMLLSTFKFISSIKPTRAVTPVKKEPTS